MYPEIVFKRYIVYGPPFEKAWGYYKPKKKIVFIGDDITALGNIKFLIEYYQETSEVILKYKEKYPRYIDIHYEIYEQKKRQKEKERNFENLMEKI